MAALFPIMLATHVTLAVSLLLPSVLLPFALRGRSANARPGPLVRLMLWLQSTGAPVIGIGLAVTGIGMLLVLGPQLLTQPWLLVALAVYGANIALAFFIQRPGLRRLLRLRSDSSDAERVRWRALARRQRYLSYVMALAVGLIAFLMMSKPQF